MLFTPRAGARWLPCVLFFLASVLPAHAQSGNQQFDSPPVDLKSYAQYDPAGVAELAALAKQFEGKRLLHVNTTRDGGGVAEILKRMIPLLRAAGVNTDWPLMDGTPEFFDLTKAMHNAIHGDQLDMSPNTPEGRKNRALYDSVTQQNIKKFEQLYPDLGPNDVVFVHDPQPAGLIPYFASKGAKVFWRFHVDSTKADPRVLEFLKEKTGDAYATGFHMPEFFFDTGTSNVVLRPSIDPNHPKNVPMTQDEIKAALAKYGIKEDGRPIITQVSRFDKLKDPEGLVDAYVKLREGGTDARLVIAGPEAVSDDPESQQVYDDLVAKVKALGKTHPDIAKDIQVVATPYDAPFINALQRESAVVVQNSIREGFGLTASEALWKGTPVVTTGAGGLSAQVRDGVDGYIANGPDQVAAALKKLVDDPALRAQMGQNGQEIVRNEFLISSNAVNYMKIASNPFIDFVQRNTAKLRDRSNARTVAQVFDDAAANARSSGPLSGISRLGDIVRRAGSRGSAPSTTPGISDLIDRAASPDAETER